MEVSSSARLSARVLISLNNSNKNPSLPVD
jgi:hypothetical protein